MLHNFKSFIDFKYLNDTLAGVSLGLDLLGGDGEDGRGGAVDSDGGR